MSQFRACRAALFRWPVHSRRHLAEQTIWWPVSSTSGQTGQTQPLPQPCARFLAGLWALDRLRTWSSGDGLGSRPAGATPHRDGRAAISLRMAPGFDQD
jgi:hypothetical protein